MCWYIFWKYLSVLRRLDYVQYEVMFNRGNIIHHWGKQDILGWEGHQLNVSVLFPNTVLMIPHLWEVFHVGNHGEDLYLCSACLVEKPITEKWSRRSVNHLYMCVCKYACIQAQLSVVTLVYQFNLGLGWAPVWCHTEALQMYDNRWPSISRFSSMVNSWALF